MVYETSLLYIEPRLLSALMPLAGRRSGVPLLLHGSSCFAAEAGVGGWACASGRSLEPLFQSPPPPPPRSLQGSRDGDP